MFAIVIITGIPLYLLQRGIVKIIVRISTHSTSQTVMSIYNVIGSILLILQVGATVYVTKFAYDQLIHKDKQLSFIDSKPLEIKCEEPLPPFTLGNDSRPSREQVSTLCSCIWGDLNDWEKGISQALVDGKSSSIKKLEQTAFPASFRRAVKKCGGFTKFKRITSSIDFNGFKAAAQIQTGVSHKEFAEERVNFENNAWARVNRPGFVGDSIS